jgi:hypothetical protein
MPKYTYKPIKEVIEETYKQNTDADVYVSLGDVDFSKATLTVVADSEIESESIRKGITDINMWVAESVED